MGQRIVKIAKDRDAMSGTKTAEWWTYTYYVRDAQGNIMATYDRNIERPNTYVSTDEFTLKETNLYGSSRLGIRDRSAENISASTNNVFGYYDGDGAIVTTGVNSSVAMARMDTLTPERELGYKAYELTNHLGNVLVTVSDRKLVHNTGSSFDYFMADVKSATDYSAFGAPMPGRTFSSANYRYGFNGQEKVDEMDGNNGDVYDFGARIYDARLARFLSIDPQYKSITFQTAYCFANNSPIQLIDYNGEVGEHPISISQIKSKLDDGKTASSYRITLYVDQPVHGSDKVMTNSGDVGHAFISITKFNTDGTMTTVTFGWYPEDEDGATMEGSPYNPTAPGSINDDSGHSYDASISISANASTVNDVINYAETYEDEKSDYNLYNNNCVNFAAGCAKAAGINVPLTNDEIPGTTVFNSCQTGYTPAQLGNDILNGKADNQPGGAVVQKPVSEQKTYDTTNTGMTYDITMNEEQRKKNSQSSAPAQKK